MRFPKRIRGLVLGAATLTAGPAVLVALTSAPAAQVATAPVQAATAGDFQHAVRIVPDPALVGVVPHANPAATPIPFEALDTPTPRPQIRLAAAPAPVPASSSSVVGIILAAAARWGVNGQWMVSIARCESTLNPRAYNPSGPYYGLFQFLMSTFRANGGTNIWDPTDQANVTAKMLAHGQAWQWSCA